MSWDAPVLELIEMLGKAGFVVVPRPQTIGGVPFEFDALLASSRTLDLAVVINPATEEHEKQIVLSIAALARALDLARSRRPLTVISVGRRLRPKTASSIARVARLLPAPQPPASPQERADAIAVLLPFAPSVTRPTERNIWDEVRAAPGTTEPDTRLVPLISAATRGHEAVTEAVLAVLNRALETADPYQ